MRQRFEPRGYQAQIARTIIERKRCAIFASMGLGKSISTLTALDTLYSVGLESRPTLVLAPLRVARDVWPAESRKWSHLTEEVVPIIGTAAERERALKRDAAIYSINYDNIPWLVDTVKGKWPFGTIVADELTRLKGYRSRQGGHRARMLSTVVPKSPRFIGLTGTPTPNGLKDLWGQMWFIDYGQRLGKTFTAFKDRWFYPSFNGFDILPKDNAQAEIQARIADVCLTIDAKDWFNLDAPIVNDIYVDLPPKAMKLYRQMEREMFIQVESADVEAFNSASMTMKCLQLANGAVYTDDKGTFEAVHDAKLDALEDVIEEAAGANVMVAYHFKSDLARLKKRFPHGRELRSTKDERDWNAGGIALLFVHPQSAGHGLNLQDGGSIACFFGHWWDLEGYSQCIERIGPVRQHQSGHARPVFIHHLLARGTLDERVLERRRTKASVQDILLNAMKRTRG